MRMAGGKVRLRSRVTVVSDMNTRLACRCRLRWAERYLPE